MVFYLGLRWERGELTTRDKGGTRGDPMKYLVPSHWRSGTLFRSNDGKTTCRYVILTENVKSYQPFFRFLFTIKYCVLLIYFGVKVVGTSK